MVVDDHPAVRASLERVISTTRDLTFVGAATDGESAVELCSELAPDVVLMDVRLPGIDGVETTRRIVAAQPGVRVVMLTSLESPRTIARAYEVGAVAYLLKDDPIRRIIATLRQVGAAAGATSERADRSMAG